MAEKVVKEAGEISDLQHICDQGFSQEWEVPSATLLTPMLRTCGWFMATQP